MKYRLPTSKSLHASRNKKAIGWAVALVFVLMLIVYKGVLWYQVQGVRATEEKEFERYSQQAASQIASQDYLNALVNICKALQIKPGDAALQTEYDRIASVAQSVDESSFVFLYLDVTASGTFEKSEESDIMFQHKNCAYGNCLYTFRVELEERNALLPFLIMATATPQELIQVRDAVFYPTAREVRLVLDAEHESKLLTFIFPVCSGERYEVEVAPI